MLTILLVMVAGTLATVALRGRPLRWIAALVAVGVAAMTALVVGQTTGAAASLRFGTLPWLRGMEEVPLFGILLDPLAAVMLVISAGVGVIAVIYSISYLGSGHREHGLDHERGFYYFWMLAFMAVMAGLALSPNLLQMFIFWELATLCSWVLISYYGDRPSLRAGFKTLTMTAIGGVCFVVALMLLFVNARSFEFSAIGGLAPGLATTVLLLLMVAAWTKAAQFPFQTWLPDAMVAPTPVNAYLDAATTVKAGVFLMARVLLANPVLPPTMPAIMLAAAVFSMSVALFFYFFQDDLKRLLAYSTMAHLGYVLVGVGLGAYGVSLGFQGAALHIITHGASKALLFFCAGAIAYATGVRSISRLSGLGSRMPLTATAFFIGLAAVTGIPPFACFWSKFYLFSAALQLGGWAGGLLLAFLLLESMISFGFLLWVGGRIFLGEPSPAAAEAREVPFAMRAGLVLSILFCLAAPFVGMAFTHLIVR